MGFHSLADIDDMTLSEYQLRMEAYGLRRVEADRRAIMSAFFAQVAKSTTGSSENPRPLYEHFSDLFDEQAEIDRVRGAYEPNYKPTSRRAREQDINRIIAERYKRYEELKKQGKLPTKRARKKGGKQ